MLRSTVTFFAYVVLILGVLGVAAGDRQLLRFINIDLAMDISRLGLAAILFPAAYEPDGRGLRSALSIFAFVYVAVAVLGMVSVTLFGILPNRLSGFDIIFHLSAGLFALGVAMWGETSRTSPAA